MIFKELLVKNKTRVDIILKKLIKNYPDSESFYKANIISLINKLCSIEEKQLQPLVIKIDKIVDEDYKDYTGGKEDCWYDVFAYSKDENDDETYALEMCDWCEWLGFEIDNNTLKDYGQCEIIAHCLNELTFFGADEEEMRKQREELIELAKDIDPNSLKSYESVEEFFKDLGIDD